MASCAAAETGIFNMLVDARLPVKGGQMADFGAGLLAVR